MPAGGPAAAAAAIAHEAAAAAAKRRAAAAEPSEPPPAPQSQLKDVLGALDDLDLPTTLGMNLAALSEHTPASSVLAKARSRESAIMESPQGDDSPSGFSPAQPSEQRGRDSDVFECDANNLNAILGEDGANRSDDESGDEDDNVPALARTASDLAVGRAGAGADQNRAFPPTSARPQFQFGTSGARGVPAADPSALFSEMMSSGPRRLRNTMAASVQRPKLAGGPSQEEELRSAELAAIFSRRKNGLSITASKAPNFNRP